MCEVFFKEKAYPFFSRKICVCFVEMPEMINGNVLPPKKTNMNI